MFLPFEPAVSDYLDHQEQVLASSQQDIVHVESNVPFSEAIRLSLILHYDQNRLLKNAERYRMAFLAWETVRLGGNPFLLTGTGFEGYFVGVCQSSGQVLDEILAMSHRMLEAIARCYRLEYGLRNQLMKTLLEGIYHPQAMRIWSTQLGAAVAQLRCKINPQQGTEFRLNTYRHVKAHPTIQYVLNEHTIHQTYEVCTHCGKFHPLSIHAENLPDKDQEAWRVACAIGCFGHPLVRQLVDRIA